MSPGSATPGTPLARVRREGATLVFEGPLERASTPAVWAAALPLLEGAEAIDLVAVPQVDSAGLALLAELQARAANRLALNGEPDGLPGLRAAYRLGDTLQTA